jgi:hypothetical protein
MTIGKLWAGRAFGTNTGNLFLKLAGEDSGLSGDLHFNDNQEGVGVFKIQGKFEDGMLRLEGEPLLNEADHEIEDGRLHAEGELNERGDIFGEWRTTVGTAGTFHLFPHDVSAPAAIDGVSAEQLHSARHDFGPIEVSRQQIIDLGNEIQKEFGRVVVTITVGTEQSRFLDDFKRMQLPTGKATFLKLFASKPDRGGINQTVTIEFGQEVNWAMTQGTSEAWVLGHLEGLKRRLARFERGYATNVKRLGIGINQLLLFGAVVYLPSLPSTLSRAILLGGAIGLAAVVQWAHNRFLPHTTIYIEATERSQFSKIWPSIASWLIALTAGAAGSLLAAYLQGVLAIPSAPIAQTQAAAPAPKIDRPNKLCEFKPHVRHALEPYHP